ncbi:MAG: hypothetical protein KGM95_04845 [Betaproteobacteria bacterium]|nr:hypothetical protein [Betaproteobacteria bacterium]
MPPDNVAPQQPAKAVRLIFEYEGETVRLISQQSVEMIIPDSDTAVSSEVAHFVDMRDAANKTLARVMVRGAFATSAEVFPERSGDPITRVDIAVPKGAFTTVVPVTDNADHITLVKVVPGAEMVVGPDGLRRAQPVTTEMASFPLSGRARPAGNGGVR